MFNFSRLLYDQYIKFKQKKCRHQTHCTIFLTISAGMCTYLPRGVRKKLLDFASRNTFNIQKSNTFIIRERKVNLIEVHALLAVQYQNCQ
jgi:hypothetical protein